MINNMINKVHERTLRVILNDHESDFETLQNNNDTCNHHRNIQTLLTEIFKIKTGFAPPIMGSILKERKNTYVRNFKEFEIERNRTVYFGLVETINYRSPQL